MALVCRGWDRAIVLPGPEPASAHYTQVRGGLELGMGVGPDDGIGAVAIRTTLPTCLDLDKRLAVLWPCASPSPLQESMFAERAKAAVLPPLQVGLGVGLGVARVRGHALGVCLRVGCIAQRRVAGPEAKNGPDNHTRQHVRSVER